MQVLPACVAVRLGEKSPLPTPRAGAISVLTLNRLLGSIRLSPDLPPSGPPLSFGASRTGLLEQVVLVFWSKSYWSFGASRTGLIWNLGPRLVAQAERTLVSGKENVRFSPPSGVGGFFLSGPMPVVASVHRQMGGGCPSRVPTTDARHPRNAPSAMPGRPMFARSICPLLRNRRASLGALYLAIPWGVHFDLTFSILARLAKDYQERLTHVLCRPT
jgi:hypothetical protein